MPWTNPRDKYLSDDLCLYRDQLGPVAQYPSITEDKKADVCIIGGGLTGVMTAYNLARAGYDTILLERHRIGWGASGRNGGQMIPGFSKDVRDVCDQWGKEAALQAYKATLSTLETIKERIATEQIDCNFTPGLIITAPSKKRIKDLQDYANFTGSNCNHEMQYLDADQTAAAMGTDMYYGSIVDMNGGRFNPLKYLTSMAAKCADLGVRIFEESPAMSMERGPEGVTIHSNRGNITAKKVVLAGDAYQGWLMPELRRKYVLVRTSMLATAPIEPEILDSIMPCNYASFEWQALLSYFSRTHDGRLIFGGGDCPMAVNEAERRRMFNTIHKRMAEIFPKLKSVHITHWWGGYFGVSRHEVPNIGHIDNTIYYANGYSGHGNIPTHMAADCIAGSMAGYNKLMDMMHKLQSPDIPGAGKHDIHLAKLGILWHRIKDKIS